MDKQKEDKRAVTPLLGVDDLKPHFRLWIAEYLEEIGLINLLASLDLRLRNCEEFNKPGK